MRLYRKNGLLIIELESRQEEEAIITRFTGNQTGSMVQAQLTIDLSKQLIEAVRVR